MAATSAPSWFGKCTYEISPTPVPGEPLADFGERRSFQVRKPHSSGEVRAKDSILRDQIFALEEQAPIDEARHVHQQLCAAVVLHVEHW